MIAVDTNILMRFLTRDDEAQFQQAYALMLDHEIYLCETVILEVEWVLRHAYAFTAEEIRSALRRLIELPGVRLSDPERIARSLDWHGQGLDFADALHLAGSQQTERMATFDRKFVERASGLGNCPVTPP